MAFNLTTNTEQGEFALQFKLVNQQHVECKRHARERIQETKRTNEEIRTWIANSATIDDSKAKETLTELLGKYEFLKDSLSCSDDSGSTEQTQSRPVGEGGHVIMAEYEALANSVLQLMKQAEDKANYQVTGNDGDYSEEEGCIHALETVVNCVKTKLVDIYSRSGSTKEQMRGVALDFSDLLEVLEREKQLLDKLVIHLQSCFGLMDKLKTAKTIGKLRVDKLAAVVTDLERSCDAFLIATELNFSEF